jgi:hypothetical protein
MGVLYGALNMADSDRLFAMTGGQRIVYDETVRIFNRHNDQVRAASRIFLERTTSDYKLRYKLPGGGRMQETSEDTVPEAVKATGGWDVAFPLRNFTDRVVGNDVALAYMTLAEYERHVQTILIRNANVRRFHILRALLNKAGGTFVDPHYGSLSVMPLANGDSVLYPPAWGSETDATADHYIGANYVTANISDTNNPVAAIAAKLNAQSGFPTGGANHAVFYHSDEHAKLAALTPFVDIADAAIQLGANADQARMGAIPDVLMGGSWEVTGRCNGAWMCRWDYMPTGYMLGINLDAPKPLIERVDPADTGLGSGLQLVGRETHDHIFESAMWRDRFGYGVGNRLNGVALQLVASTTYTTPTVYA